MSQATTTLNTRRSQQKKSAAGMVIGAVAGGFAYILLREILPSAASPGAARLWILLLPATMLFVLVAAVGQGRFLTDAIDPLARREGSFVTVTNRVLRNTVEQTLILTLASLALVELAPEGARIAFPAVAVLFVLARLTFWFGYLIDPIHRAAGMALTMLINIALLVWAVVALVD